MLSRQLSRQLIVRAAALRPTLTAIPVVQSGAGLAPVEHSSSTCYGSRRRFIMSEANLSPMEELSGARQKLRQVLDDYRQNK